MSQRQAVIFDLGGVLLLEAESNLHKAPNAQLQKLLGGQFPKMCIFNRAFAFAALFCGTECKTDWILGNIHGQEIVTKIHENIDKPEWVHFFDSEYEKELIKHGIPFVIVPELLAELTEVLQEGVDFVQKCKASGMQVAVISNWDPYSWEILKQKMPEFFALFSDDLLIIPHMVGATKPAPEIYAYAAKKLNIEPKNCFFVDDSKTNVEGAETCGMVGINHVTWSKTEQELIRRGLQLQNRHDLVTAWQKFLAQNSWQKLIQNVEPRKGGCGIIYELPNFLNRPNEGFAIVDMREILYAEPHYHAEDEAEIYFVLSGTALVVVSGREYKVKTGDVVVIEPYQSHFTIPDENYVIGVVNTPPSCMEKYKPLRESNDSVNYDHAQFDKLVMQRGKSL